ncbi:MAG TPA: cytochrome c [Pyrinomonadaceae bacterium]|nr:cytochrome c [Pyrinomonadaceae bacterium]
MKVRVLVLLLPITVFLVAGCKTQTTSTNNGAKPTPTSSGTPDALVEAVGIYAKDCQECHGPDGKGGRVKLDDGSTIRVPTLREGHALRHPNSEFVKQIMQGGDGMPAFKDKLSQTQVDDLVSYLRREFQPGLTPPPEKGAKSH